MIRSCHSRINFGKFIEDEYYLPRKSRHPSGDRISGGYDAKVNEFPSYVSFTIKDKSNELIGIGNGVTLNNRLILTTTSRVSEPDVKYSVASGIWHYSTWDERKTKTYEVERVCASDKFAEHKRTNDIAILRLKSPMEKPQPAILPTESPLVGFRGTVVGISFINGGIAGIEPGSFQASPVERVECKKAFNHPTPVCFQSYQSDHVGSACTEDGGGPLYGRTDTGKQVVIGFVSEYSIEGCIRGKRSKNVYSNICNLSNEILKLAQECQT